MSKSMNMLRTRRRDNNVKPNRRLDRKSSRGMIYENEELRLKTININAEIERGQSDIKKLRRENEMLKKEIWYLRDEYEKLDKLLKQKQVDFATSEASTSSSCSSSESESAEMETTQNQENVQKSTKQLMHVEFEQLSIVPEEPSSDKSSEGLRLRPDQSYPAILPTTFRGDAGGGTPDVVVKLDNRDVASWNGSTFSNGGNVEDLLKDIESISMDILRMSSPPPPPSPQPPDEKFKSEISMVLMPSPMPLLGFEKYSALSHSEDWDMAPHVPSASSLIPTPPTVSEVSKTSSNLRRKVSLLHFKGKKDKMADRGEQCTVETSEEPPLAAVQSSDSDRAPVKSTSASPERKKHHQKRKKQHRKKEMGDAHASERSLSVCTDRSLALATTTDDCAPSSERERTNSVSSSCGTGHCHHAAADAICRPQVGRGVRSGSAGRSGGKIPWCACWGNGCL